jgi:hypothetical protein
MYQSYAALAEPQGSPPRKRRMGGSLVKSQDPLQWQGPDSELGPLSDPGEFSSAGD